VRFSVRVTNEGAVPGAEVCQVYLSYPEAAGEPPLVLRGFAKTALLPPGDHADLAFALTPRDLSTYAADGWAVSYGEFAVSVGASSRDVRLRGPFRYSY
jgi:beta-glucosidase